MSDLFGNHIVGFPTRRLISCEYQFSKKYLNAFLTYFITYRKECFFFPFRKIITRYRRIVYNLNVMRQSACLVFDPIMDGNYDAFFNCTPVGRASDSMVAPT